MARYTTTELDTTALDRITETTPAGVIQNLEDRVLAFLEDDHYGEIWERVHEAFGDALAELDNIEKKEN